MKKVLIAPSILSADFNCLAEEINKVSSADYLHFDVMDGHFVPNISFGIPVLKSISGSHNLVNDVHIMISEPTKYAERFFIAGADILTFHLEAIHSEEEFKFMVDSAKKFKKKIGIAISPKTKAEAVLPYVKDVDLVLVMSVEPGFGGQAFMPTSLEKIALLRKYIDENNLKTLIEVDGGINEITGKECVEAGVDILVAGNYIFKAPDYAKVISLLRGDK